MKVFTENEFKKYLLSQVEKIIISEQQLKTKKILPKQDFESSKKETISESENVQIEEVKLLAEEIKRMKELVDFRSPLLKKNGE